ncbi:uncharacterized protein LOC116430825 isoform X11 [Nomia melanderi]|uniref:uncharacterized protein LOC116430825 isoform X11 n=1 Tax=Nomia melanderi TaxID=2448451 RepID=UPI003FCCC6C4
MSCNVTPLKKYAEISYRVKCVSVENERVFGDVYVTQQTRNLLYCADGYQFPSLYAGRKCNLIQKRWEGPDFMELNKKKPIRRASVMPVKATKNCLKRSRSTGDTRSMVQYDCKNNGDGQEEIEVRNLKTYPTPLPHVLSRKQRSVSLLVDQLLLDIYGLPDGDRGRSESDSTASSLKARPRHQHLQKARLLWKSKSELQILILNLRDHINHTGGILIRQLRRKDYLTIKQEKQFDIITAYLRANNGKFEDTKMRFSLTPQPGESGFIQWLDAMKMVARLQGGIPPEFRKKLWLTLAERHLEQRGVDWKQAEKVCFNEWSNPDDEELGIQIVKDLHRTGCSLFCGAAGRDNQAVLRRVLLGFARWNKSVGYCQGLNVLAALVLQVMDRAESAAVKVMIYLIEGVLPEGYFGDNLRGLSVDMAVFRDLLRTRLPKLSKHLEALQNDAKDKATGYSFSSNSYEPPLTNVFTMQWFLTLFCHCLPQEAVLRVWDLIFLEGDEILLRTALTIWEGLSDRIMTVTSADEFYSIMGVLTREMLEFTDTNSLIKNIVSMGPLQGVTGLREKHRYNITPWARKLSDDDDSDTEEDERLAVAAAMFSMAQRLKKDMLVDRIPQTIGALQAMAPSSDRERLALDISTLKQQYAKLRERQRQAHIILSAACARQTMVPPPTSQAMNHLLVGKNALVSAKNRPLSLPSTAQAKTRPTPLSHNRRDRQQGVTLHWKDTKKAKQKAASASGVAETASLQPQDAELASPKRGNGDSDSDSTSTELCDEPDRLSDVDSEDLTSASESYVMATDEERTFRGGDSPMPDKALDEKNEPASEDVKQDSGLVEENLGDMSIAKITDQIRRLSAEDDNNSMVPQSFSVLNKHLPGDSTIEPSLEKDLSPADLKTEFSLDTGVEKSLALDEYEYLSFGVNTVSVKEEEVLVHERHRPKGPARDIDDFADSLNDPVQDITSTVAQRQDPNTFSEFSMSLATKYDHVSDEPTPADTGYGKIAEKTESLDKVYNDASDRTVSLDEKCDTLTETATSLDTSTNNIPILTTESTNSQVTGKAYFIDRISTTQTKTYSDMKKSPQTPESNKSFSSGETMGPDSKPSSMTISPRTPVRSDSRDYLMDKSVSSSISSDSKTLVFRSVDSDVTRDSDKTDTKKSRTDYDKSNSLTPISTDSLRIKSDTSPKLVISSSSDSCSPGKLKSSERSFSSDLQSPISANSIKYTSNYNRRGQDDVSSSPMDLSAATSPFYPISNPNQKTPPSPYSASRRRSSLDSTETSPEQKSSSSKESNKYLGYQSKFDSTLKSDVKDTDTGATRSEDFLRKDYSSKKDELSTSLSDRRNGGTDAHFYQSSSTDYYRKDKDLDDGSDDPLSEKDVVPSLPREKLDKHYLNYRYRDRSKLLERSSSSLDSRRFVDMKSSVSSDEFSTSMVKKRSSDILEDIKHLEAKANDGTSDPGIMTKKSSYIWEDLKSLEARRQDTFSDSASSFSKRRLEIPDISVTGEGRKSYIVHPRININENTDSILNTVARSQNNGDADDGRESKLGVWTKVKPRKKNDNGRRNSDRALKIIQENSVILQKILACQAKKRLPDLEEISKEISISPINEEISKIFSPILEKMGLNEHEINEELARINFKDFDNMTATSVSEFDAKINEELSRLSLIDDNEQVDHFDVDEVIAHQYSDTREALIDRKINEELSKLLLNYEDRSPASLNLEKGSSSQNVSEIDGLDLSSISTNVFSYKSSNDSIDAKSELGSAQEPSIQVEKFSQYTEKVLPYSVSKYRDDDSSPKSDIDIYRELEKLDKISSAQVLPEPRSLELPSEDLSSIPYVSNTSPFKDVPPIRYTTKPVQYDTSPLKTLYDPYKSFDFKPKLSPKHASTNPFVAASYDKPVIDTAFEYINNKPELSVNTFETHLKSPLLTKESLEFRVRYDEEPSRDISSDYMSLQPDRSLTSSKSPYYSNGNTEPLTPTKYLAKEDRCLDSSVSPFMEFSGESSDLRRKYDPLSPKEYAHGKNTDYERHLSTLPSIEAPSELGSYLPTKNLDYHPLSPNRQYSNQCFPTATNHYASKLSPGLADESKRPVSHPEFPGKITIGKYTELPDRGAASSYQKSSLSLGNIGHSSKGVENNFSTVTSPKTQFSPFPVRNAPRKPKELTLKLGLYSQKNPDAGQLKRS